MKFETKAVHIGRHPDKQTGAVATPIHLSTTFEREADGTFPHGNIYSRNGNPNRLSLEECIASLEGGETAAAFSSGQAATMSVLQTLKPGDHVIFPDNVYWGSVKLLKDIFHHWGISYTLTNATDLNELEKSFTPKTKLVWLESPSNPLLKITDLQKAADMIHAHQAVCVVDNTWSTPVIQRPFELGADLVMHSTTKYFGGNSDVLGGVIVSKTDNEFFQKIRMIQQTGGAVPSPFECWLILRSMPSLSLRMNAHSENAQELAEFLEKHPKVTTVFYPGLISHPGHLIAKKQMNGFGGMLSFLVKGGEAAAVSVAGKVKVFTRATSLGGSHSLIEHRASVEGPDTQTPWNLLRISIGLEHIDDLIDDLDQALM